MPVSNGLPNNEMDYMPSHYRSRSPVNSPPSHHHNSGHTKICYPTKPLSLDVGPYVPSPNMRHKIHQARSPPYLHRSPVYNNPVWKKEPPMEPTMYPPHPHPHHPQHGDYKPPPPPPPMDMRRRYPQYEHHHHHQEVPASVVTRPPTPPQRRTTTPPGSGDDDDGDGEGEPPVYVLPNDFDLQRDRVEPHIITYHSPKGEPGEGSPNNDEHNELPKDDSKPRTMPPEDERDSPVSDASSGKSTTDENTPVPNTPNDQQLACKICKQYFPTKSTLYKHLRGHSSDEKPFKCMECGQGFTLSSNLRQHRIIHRGYKPFQCEYCGKKFMRSNVYKQHRRIHTGEQMHKCDHCPSEFLQRYALIKHKKKAHNVETFDK